MSPAYEGKTLIGEQVARALDAAATLQKFEAKHHLFIEANPPELASAMLKVPWVSWPARYLNIIAGYFGNDGWTACENSREKIVDGVAVAVHGLNGEKVRVPLVALGSASDTDALHCSPPHLDVVANAGCKIGIQNQSLN